MDSRKSSTSQLLQLRGCTKLAKLEPSRDRFRVFGFVVNVIKKNVLTGSSRLHSLFEIVDETLHKSKFRVNMFLPAGSTPPPLIKGSVVFLKNLLVEKFSTSCDGRIFSATDIVLYNIEEDGAVNQFNHVHTGFSEEVMENYVKCLFTVVTKQIQPKVVRQASTSLSSKFQKSISEVLRDCTKLMKLKPSTGRFSVFGFVTSIIKEKVKTTNKYHTLFEIIDETYYNLRFRVNLFSPTISNHPPLRVGSVVFIQKLLVEKFNTSCDGRIYSTSDIVSYNEKEDGIFVASRPVSSFKEEEVLNYVKDFIILMKSQILPKIENYPSSSLCTPPSKITKLVNLQPSKIYSIIGVVKSVEKQRVALKNKIHSAFSIVDVSLSYEMQCKINVYLPLECEHPTLNIGKIVFLQNVKAFKLGNIMGGCIYSIHDLVLCRVAEDGSVKATQEIDADAVKQVKILWNHLRSEDVKVFRTTTLRFPFPKRITDTTRHVIFRMIDETVSFWNSFRIHLSCPLAEVCPKIKPNSIVLVKRVEMHKDLEGTVYSQNLMVVAMEEDGCMTIPNGINLSAVEEKYLQNFWQDSYARDTKIADIQQPGLYKFKCQIAQKDGFCQDKENNIVAHKPKLFVNEGIRDKLEVQFKNVAINLQNINLDFIKLSEGRVVQLSRVRVENIDGSLSFFIDCAKCEIFRVKYNETNEIKSNLWEYVNGNLAIPLVLPHSGKERDFGPCFCSLTITEEEQKIAESMNLKGLFEPVVTNPRLESIKKRGKKKKKARKNPFLMPTRRISQKLVSKRVSKKKSRKSYLSKYAV